MNSTLKDAANFISTHEGLRLEAYQDQGGTWTIGFGHTGSDVEPGMIWTVGQAYMALRKDTEWAMNCLLGQEGAEDLTTAQVIALTSMIFNIGCEAFKKSTLAKLIKAKASPNKVTGEMMRWVYVTINGEKVVSKGLVARRKAEADLYLSDGKSPLAAVIVSLLAGVYLLASQARP